MRLLALAALLVAGCGGGADACDGYPGQTCISLELRSSDGSRPLLAGVRVQATAGFSLDKVARDPAGPVLMPVAIPILPPRGGAFTLSASLLDDVSGGSIGEVQLGGTVPDGQHTRLAGQVTIHGAVPVQDLGGADLSGCGQPGGLCCPGSICLGGVGCDPNTQRCANGCGGGSPCPGGACCDKDVCVGPANLCSNSGVCLEGACQTACGLAAKPCCASGCAKGLVCAGGMCAECSATQPCANTGCCDLKYNKCIGPLQMCSDGTSCNAPSTNCGTGGADLGSGSDGGSGLGNGQPCVSNACGSGCCAAGKFCVDAGKPCAPGIACSAAICACGSPGQPCCAGNTCAGGCCDDGLCVGAGTQCVGAGALTCQANGACGTCGNVTFPACGNPQLWCSQPSSVTLIGGTGMCEACGAPGQTCCGGKDCGSRGCCVRNKCVAEGAQCPNNGVCTQGSCTPCGAAGQPCCNWSGMDECTQQYTTCNATKYCVACGGMNQPCCADGACGPLLFCNATQTCLPCGHDTQPCCAGATCPASTGHSCNGSICS